MQTTDFTHIAAVDGGGTGCRAAIADLSGHVLGRGEAGPANATTNAAQALANTCKALSRAIAEAGLDETALSGCFARIGLAGVINDAIAQQIRAGLPVGDAVVTEDREIFAAGALGCGPAVLAAIGTGSTFAAYRDGTLRLLGGWGLHLGDQASGAWLGRRVLEHVLLCHDGLAEHSALTRRTLHDQGGQPADLVLFAAEAQPSDYARLAPSVVAAAQQGDPVGLALMQEGAAYIGQALHALDLSPHDRLCLAGGVGPAYAAYLPDALRDQIIPPQGDALDGALRLARDTLNGVVR